LPGGRRALLDAAHNRDGAAVLAGFLRRLDRLREPADLLFGVLADKDYREMLDLLAPRARHLVLTRPPSPRAKDPAELLPLLAGRDGVEVEPDPGRALDRALALGGQVLVACGSIFLVGEVRRGLRERFGVPAPP
ncbi:MAG TPA: bifunctional folylpolyglutamate synthase/dihydrofolate synthase, partial [Thermoanaerobaculia bacterium]|nr:bifunctional folylpolyglutamate synthase/dihydrofolate synthase [Thermoanaerobaculia bacterium]